MGKLTEVLRKASGNYSFITVTSNESAIIEGCRRIIECSDVLVIVRTVKFTVEIFGTDMKVRSFNCDSVEVTGRILSLELTAERSGEKV